MMLASGFSRRDRLERDIGLPNDSGYLTALGFLLSQLIAGFAKMNLHGVPIEPVAIPLGEDLTTLKALKSIFRQFTRGREHTSRPLN
jgi:hypothetical protein